VSNWALRATMGACAVSMHLYACVDPADTHEPPDEPSSADAAIPDSAQPSDAAAPTEPYEDERCAYFSGLRPGVESAIDRLRQARGDEGIGNVSAPGFDDEGILLSLGCCGQVRRISGTPYLISVEPAEDTAEAHCEAFISEWGDLWAMGEPGMALVHERTKHDDRGGAHCIYEQTYYGVPVLGMRFVVHIDPDGRVTGANSSSRCGATGTPRAFLVGDAVECVNVCHAPSHCSSTSRVHGGLRISLLPGCFWRRDVRAGPRLFGMGGVPLRRVLG
jgi:hypothetical protein